MASFGSMLRWHRRQCQDPLRGGLLTQDRMGELLGYELGHAGYSGAAVSDWERSKSKIDEDDRLVLVGLVNVLYKHGGLHSVAEANDFLRAGNYRSMDEAECQKVFSLPAPEFDIKRIEEDRPHAVRAAPSHLVPVSSERRKQLILLDRVKSFWVNGVLEQSLHDVIPLEINHRRYDKAVERPWRSVLGPAVYRDLANRADGKKVDMFRSVNRALLILGAPGSGKSTMLLTLARDLALQAEKDAAEPIPVVLNLVSWAERRDPLGGWVVEELTAKYQIPRRLGRSWLENAELLLLLDGFDEVPSHQRPGCAKAINQFRNDYGLIGLAVCSRVDEYEAAGVQLRLGGAILLEPLTQAQVEEYLNSVEVPLASLNAALRQDAALREMARSPLMLNIMRLAYSHVTEDQLAEVTHPLAGSGERMLSLRKQLFSSYVESMFRRRSAAPFYSPEQTVQWLRWLSRNMSRHNQSVFYMEQIQPSWLPSRRWRWFYLVISRLATGLFGGIIMWLLLLLLRRIVPDVPTPLSEQVAIWLSIAPAGAEATSFVVGNLLLSLVVAGIHGLHYERRWGREDSGRTSARQGWKQVAAVGLSVGFLTTLALIPFGEPLLALAWGIAEAVMYMVVSRYADGRNYRNEVRTVESIGWSWTSSLKGIGFMMLLAAVAELIETRIYGYNGVIRTVLTFGLAGLILGGLRGHRLETITKPNQGIQLSMKNAVIAGMTTALSLGLLTLFLRNAESALITALFLMLLVVPLFGGSNAGKHFLVRAFLWYKGIIPLNCVRFLDHATELIFLRKVGRGYMFIHHTLMEYFSGLEI